MQSLPVLGTLPHLLAGVNEMKKQPSIQLLRHATLVLEINGMKLLVDPMLSPKDGMDPVQNCGNDTRFPMVELPVNGAALNKILTGADAVVITHTHRDHWDAAAQNMLDKNKPIFCQPVDQEKIAEQGFKNIQPIETVLDWKGIKISRTGGRHGTGDIGKRMGEVSGFVFQSKGESVYLAGDTVWCEEVEKALDTFKPSVTILNAGGAKFLTGDPITMTPEDVMKVHARLPATKLIAVHMDTVNHCFIRRTDLARALAEKGLASRVLVPGDGETVQI